jgi:hypothetical protein
MRLSNGIRDYYHAGVIGYGGAGVVTAFGGQLAKNDLVPISLIGNSPARVERRVKTVSDGQGGTMQRPYSLPIWIDPVAGGGTPMCAALNRARTIYIRQVLAAKGYQVTERSRGLVVHGDMSLLFPRRWYSPG